MKNVAVLVLTILCLGLVSCNKNSPSIDLTQNQEIHTIETPTTITPEPTPYTESIPEQESLMESYIRDSYDMELTLDVENNRISGVVRVTLLNYSNDVWQNICFRDYNTPVLDSFRSYVEKDQDEPWFSPAIREEYHSKKFSSGISGATNLQTGQQLNVDIDENDASIVFIELETPLKPNDVAEIDLYFAADIPPGWYRYSHYSLADGKMSYSLANFYPVLAVYEDGKWITHPDVYFGESFYSKCSDYFVKLMAPDGYTIIASGNEYMLSSDSGNALWEITAENMRDFTFTASNCLEVISGEWNGIQINSYYYNYYDGTDNVSHQQYGEAVLNAGLNAIKIYTDSFGAYPYGELDIVESGISSAGMENCGLVRISSSAAEEIMNRETLQPVNLVAHEVAHEWFYAVVGNDQYTESWLDEGFATFATLLYKRSYMTDDDFKEEINFEPPSGYINLSLGEFDAKSSGFTMAYKGGAALLWRLMSEMGEVMFFDMMRDYYQTFQFKEVKTDDFVSLVRIWTKGNAEIETIINEYLYLH